MTGAPSSISLGPGLTLRQSDDPGAEVDAEVARLNEETARSRHASTETTDRRGRAEDSAAPDDEGGASQAQQAESRIEPGFHVVRRPGTREDIKQRLFGTTRPDVDAMFERLNRHLGDYVLPGSLVVLSDPGNRQCTAEEAALQDQAHLAQAVIQQLEPDQAQAMINSWGVLAEMQTASQTLGDLSTQGGTTVAGLSNLKQASAETLDEIAQIADQGADTVKVQGQGAFQRLGDIATAWVDQPFDLPDTAHSLKQAIGVRVEQAVHTIAQAAEGIPAFRVPTVADAIRSAGHLVKPLNYANYLMIALDYTSTRLKVERGCRLAVGPEECRRVALVEYGKLTGRTFGAMGGGWAGSQVCLAVGVTPDTMACAIVVGSTGAYAGMNGGEPLGGLGGEKVYDLTTDEGGAGAP